MSRGSIIDQIGKLKFVVASTYRSGTQFTADVLSKLGFKAGHEDVFRPDRVLLRELRSRAYDVDVSGAAYHWIDEIKQAKVPIVHLIRNPIDTINSMYGYNNGSIPVETLMDLWVKINSLIEDAQPECVIHLEAFDTDLAAFLKRFKDRSICLSDVSQVSSKAHRGVSSATGKIGVTNLSDDVKSFASRYYMGKVKDGDFKTPKY